MSWSWACDRAFSAEEASDLLGIPFATMRRMLASGGNEFVSAKIGSQRRLSAEDIAIAAVARLLIGVGYTTTDAFAEAGRHLAGRIEEVAASGDLFLSVPAGGGSAGSTRAVLLAEIPKTLRPEGTVVALAGKTVADTIAAAKAAYQ